MSINRNDIVKLGNVEEPIVVYEFLVYIQWEVILLVLNRLAHSIEKLEYSVQEAIHSLFDLFFGREDTTFLFLILLRC